MIEAWIDKQGKIHDGGNHLMIAYKIFPKSDNAEWSCKKAGYVKVGVAYNGSPYMENYNKDRATQAQINTVTKVWEDHYKDKKRNKL